MPLPSKKRHTVNDIYALPEGQRAELIDGQLYDMAPPTRKHQGLVMELSALIREYIRDSKGGCKVYPSPFAVFLKTDTEDDDSSSYVEPDISVICDKNKLNHKGCVGAPDWVIEIVSPSSRRLDYYQKLALYQAGGVQEYWIVDPDKEIIMVYDLAHETPPVIYRFTDTVSSCLFPELSIDFSSLDP